MGKSESMRANKALRHARARKNAYRISIIENHLAAVAAGKTPQPTAARSANKKLGRASAKTMPNATGGEA